MKKLITGVTLVLLLVTFTVSAAEKYADAKPLIKEMIKVLEKFVVSLEKADNGAAIVAALDSHTKGMTKLTPGIKEMYKKYPEMKKNDVDLPDSMKHLDKKMKELTKKFVKLYSKIRKYGEDPKVKTAMERWQKAMMAMDPEKG